MRATTAFNRVLDLDGVWVRQVDIGAEAVVVGVALRRRVLVCPHCGVRTAARYDTRPVASRWRHLDAGACRVVVTAQLRRLDCPAHGVVVEAVEFARHGSRFTRDFEALVAWLATRTDKTATARLCRIGWRTVGRICQRVVDEQLDPGRLDRLAEVGIDELSYRKRHHYLTLVSNHQTAKIVWAGQGRSAATLEGFFDELGPQRAQQVKIVTLDLGPAFRKAVRRHAPQATICADPFHLVALANKAVDRLRRMLWQQLRGLEDPAVARALKHTRWALLKDPATLTDAQQATLGVIRRADAGLWRAYRLKEAFREIVTARGLDEEVAARLLDKWIGWAQRSRLEPFVKLQRTVRVHRQEILATIRLGRSNGRVEGLNNRVRLITRRGFGFHSAAAVAALVMLSCGPINLRLPHEASPRSDPHP